MTTEMKVAHKQDGKVVELTPAEKKLYQVLSELPKPETAMKLSRSQKKWWYWFGNEFLTTKQLSKLDLIHLQKASVWMDARSQAIEEINELGYYDGLVQKFRTGATNISAHVTILEKADKHLNDVSAHFGLSIKDRLKLTPEEKPTDQLSLFDQVIQKMYQQTS